MRALGPEQPLLDITLVIMTRDRVDDVLATLERLTALPERVPIVVVDNGSTDSTVEEVRRRFPQVEVLPLSRNVGVEARNMAVRRAATAYIAFNDDDSWWEPAALSRVVELLEAHPRLGAVVAHVVVEPGGRDDPTSLEMRDSPLDGDAGVPGIPVLGFLACSAAVRRSAFLEVGASSAGSTSAGRSSCWLPTSRRGAGRSVTCLSWSSTTRRRRGGTAAGASVATCATTCGSCGSGDR